MRSEQFSQSNDSRKIYSMLYLIHTHILLAKIYGFSLSWWGERDLSGYPSVQPASEHVTIWMTVMWFLKPHLTSNPAFSLSLPHWMDLAETLPHPLVSSNHHHTVTKPPPPYLLSPAYFL